MLTISFMYMYMLGSSTLSPCVCVCVCEQAEVLYLDHGGSEPIDTNRLCHLPPEHNTLPYQVIYTLTLQSHCPLPSAWHIYISIYNSGK